MKKAVIFLWVALFIVNGFGFMGEGYKALAEEDATKQVTDIRKAKNDLIKSGKFYYSSRQYEAAIKQWEEALSLDPGSDRIKTYLKEARVKLERRIEKEKREARKDVVVINVTSPPKEETRILTLQDCIDIAIRNHLPLQIAQKNVKLGEMRCFEARRNLLPTGDFKWEETYGAVNERRYYGKKVYLEGQQALFHGGELYFTMKQAEVNLKIVKEEYNRIKNDLILQVKKAYYTLSKAEENYKLQVELKKEVDAIFDMVDKGHEAGAISKLEFLNVGSQKSQVVFQFVSAEGDAAIADLILKQTMDLNSKDSIEIQPDLEFKKIDIDGDRVLAAAFINRPEMKINSLMVEYYKYERSIAKAKGWPKIDIMGSWGLAKEEYIAKDNGARLVDGNWVTDLDAKMEQQWYGGIKASMPFGGSTAEYSITREQWVPVVSAYQGTEACTQAVKVNILDNLKYYSDKQAADIDFDRARQEFIKVRHDITLEAKESCFSYEKALIQLQTASNKVEYQTRDLEFTRLRRGMDELQDSNLVESMIKLAQEKFGYVQALTDCHISLAAINKAIGVSDYFTIEEEKGRGI